MKTRMTLIVMMMMCMSAFAAFQYSITESLVAGQWKDGGQNKGVYGYAYTISVSEGTGSIYIMDKISSLGGGNNELLSQKVNMTSTNNYGWVDVATGLSYDADGEQKILYNQAINQWNPVVTQTGYKLGEFNAGDTIGVWLKPIGKTFTGASVFDKTNPINSQQMNSRDGFVGTDALGNNLFQLDFTSTGSIHFGIIGFAADSGPVGQPLPGALATLLIGGAMSGAAGIKARRKRNA